MAKGGSRISSGSGGGIMGSGIFGVFGTTIRCDSKDDSLYCNIMKYIYNNKIYTIVFNNLYY